MPGSSYDNDYTILKWNASKDDLQLPEVASKDKQHILDSQLSEEASQDKRHILDLQLREVASKDKQHILDSQLPEEASKDEQHILDSQLPEDAGPKPSYALESLADLEPLPVNKKNIGWCSDLPNESGETFDSKDEMRTKETLKQSLAKHPSVSNPDLPVQYNDPTAKRLYELFYQSHIEGDEKQNITSTLYQAESGPVIFCMDTRNYDPSKEIDPCYSYARYGIGLYLSQHLLYKIRGVKNTDFIADHAQAFYEQFIADIQTYQESLDKLSEYERAKKLNDYAREYLSDVAHSIAEQLTDTFGEHEEFKTVEKSLESLDKILPAASMAWKPIPLSLTDDFKYSDPNIPELSNISEDYNTTVHPKTNEMTEQIKQYWIGKLKLSNKTEERKPRPASDLDLFTEDLMEDNDTTYNFLDELHPCEEALLQYLGDVILAGEVAFPSQLKKLPGAKNFRTFEQMGIIVDENGAIQLRKISNITGCSTALAPLENTTLSVLVDFNNATLMQKLAMMTRGTDRPLRLCSISLCGIDLTTAFANKILHKPIVPLDKQIIATTDAAAGRTNDQVFFSNLTTNHEKHLEKLQHAPRLLQEAVAEIMSYENLQEMLHYIHYTAGIDDNIHYIETFRDELAESIVPEDLERLEDLNRLNAYLKLMEKVKALHQSGTLDSLEVLLDTIAIFSMLCTVYNELILKYDPDKKYANIIVPINCASGKNRTGAVISHCLNLSRTADIIIKKFGIGELENLLDPKYHPLRRAIGNDQARKGLISKDNGRRTTLGTEGIRFQSIGSISRIDVSKSVRERMCSLAAEFKGLMANVYIHKEGRIIDIFRDPTLKQIADAKDMDIPNREKAYRDIIDRYSIFCIQHTLRILRAPDALKWLPAVDAEIIHTILIERIETLSSKKINSVQDNLGLYLPSIQPKVTKMAMQGNPNPALEEENDGGVESIICDNPNPVLEPKHVENVEPTIPNSSSSFFSPIGNRLGSSLSPSQGEDKSLPEKHKEEKSNSFLKKGSIISGIFIALVSIVAFMELHSGISIFATLSLAGTAMTGWFYAREDKKENSSYRENSSCSFFGRKPVVVENLGAHNASTNLRPEMPKI